MSAGYKDVPVEVFGALYEAIAHHFRGDPYVVVSDAALSALRCQSSNFSSI